MFTKKHFFILFCNIIELCAVNALVINILSNMQLTGVDIMSKTVVTAKYKLSQHKVEGQNSNLTIFQVAKLMDAIKRCEESDSTQERSIYFSLN